MSGVSSIGYNLTKRLLKQVNCFKWINTMFQMRYVLILTSSRLWLKAGFKMRFPEKREKIVSIYFDIFHFVAPLASEINCNTFLWKKKILLGVGVLSTFTSLWLCMVSDCVMQVKLIKYFKCIYVVLALYSNLDYFLMHSYFELL